VSGLEEIAYLRRQAKAFRRLGEAQADPAIRRELLALAKECERVADEVANRLEGSGN
jgi:hypothetical protein